MLTVHIHVRVHRVARAGLVSLVKLQRLPRNGIRVVLFFFAKHGQTLTTSTGVGECQIEWWCVSWECEW